MPHLLYGRWGSNPILEKMSVLCNVMWKAKVLRSRYAPLLPLGASPPKALYPQKSSKMGGEGNKF